MILYIQCLTCVLGICKISRSVNPQSILIYQTFFEQELTSQPLLTKMTLLDGWCYSLTKEFEKLEEIYENVESVNERLKSARIPKLCSLSWPDRCLGLPGRQPFRLVVTMLNSSNGKWDGKASGICELNGTDNIFCSHVAKLYSNIAHRMKRAPEDEKT